ncbi:MAG: hypothetical protein FRX49_09078 [Trebouxia sp. A1-2]|nr:MAG: hypothetical protein FRX49_09078 [Trebouxia sp. A1-2]
MNLPSDPGRAQNLLKFCQAAPRVKGADTVGDVSVRISSQLDPALLSCNNPDLPDIVTKMVACVHELESLKPPPVAWGLTGEFGNLDQHCCKYCREAVSFMRADQQSTEILEMNAFGKLVECTIREGTRTSKQIAVNSKRKPWIMSCVKIRSRPDPAAKAYKHSMTKLAKLKQVDEIKPCVQAVDVTEDDAPASKRQRV